jgi:type II secretory pathway predicted ATPase ExeA
MYQSHWGLRESPFRDCLDPRFFYQSPTHEEALARLHFLVQQRRRVGLLMGPAGSGKSLVLEVLAAELVRRGTAVARLNLLGLEPAEMLWTLAGALGCNLDATDSLAVLWRAVSDRLVEVRYQQIDTVVLMDAADQAGRPLVPHLVRLAKFDPSPQSRLTLILSGERERMGRLGETLLQLSELRIDLDPWEAGDVAGFLKTSLSQAGCPAAVFDPAAIARLHKLSHGIPRQVRQLADLALMAGAGREMHKIDANVVESVYHELSGASSVCEASPSSFRRGKHAAGYATVKSDTDSPVGV